MSAAAAATAAGSTEPPSHRRYDPLRGRWVVVSAGRARRPWNGDVDRPAAPAVPRHDPTCPLCPGNGRPVGRRNPAYTGPYVFDNDFPAFRPSGEPGEPVVADGPPHPLLRARPAAGTCRVLCFGPGHDRHLAAMSGPELATVVETWIAQVSELSQHWRWVQVFENRGAAMGASNPHPHGQIWAGDWLPDEPAAEDDNQRDYFSEHGRPLLLDYAELELARAGRVVVAGAEWLAVVPYWAVWPFETMLLPRRTATSLPALDQAQCADLVAVLHRLLAAYDGLFGVPFPYSMGWHGAPGPRAGQADASGERGERGERDRESAHWQLHAHFYPPLLRSPTVRKFLVGYEMLAQAQRDLTAEDAAARLREHVPEAGR